MSAMYTRDEVVRFFSGDIDFPSGSDEDEPSVSSEASVDDHNRP